MQKKALSLEEKFRIIDSISEKVNQKNGSVIMGRIDSNPEIKEALTIKYIPTPSAPLNMAIGGGIPRRRCSIICGLPDSGKTSLILETIGKAMQEDPNFFALWLESENSLEKDYICQTFKIDPKRFIFMQFDIEMGAEAALDTIHSVLMTNVIDMVCINSLKCLVPTKENESSLSDSLVAVQARLNSRMTRKFTSIVAKYDVAFVIVTHLSTEIGSLNRDFLDVQLNCSHIDKLVS